MPAFEPIEAVDNENAARRTKDGTLIVPRTSDKKRREDLLQRARSLEACYARSTRNARPPSFAPSSNLPPFQHTPLQSGYIRLLKLHQDISGIYTQLEDFALESQPAYTCMSYVWGSSNSYASIPCNNRSMTVTDHLRQGLLCIHAAKVTTDPIWLWIDAICINQSDEVEKAAQVTKMHEIFANASLVLAWLGPESENSHRAFAFMPSAVRSLWNLYDRGDYDTQTQAEKWESLEDLYSSEWIDLHDLFALDYWLRLWIVQEVVGRHIGCPFDVLCGHDRTSGELLLEFAGLYHEMAMSHPTARQYGTVLCFQLCRLRRAKEIWSEHGEYRGFAPSSFVEICRNRQVSEHVDKVYAILSLLNGEVRAAIEVDYSKSNRQSVRKVAMQFSRLLFEYDGPEYLYYLFPTDKTCELPSWAFDLWTPRAQTSFFPSTGWCAGQIGSDLESPLEGCQIRDGGRDDVVRINGVIVDLVHAMHLLGWEDAVSDGYVMHAMPPGHFLSCVDACRAIAVRPPVTSEEDLARVLVADCASRDASNRSRHTSYDSDVDVALCLSRVSATVSKQEKEGNTYVYMTGLEVTVSQYLDVIHTHWGKRSFFTTRSGRLGLCRMEARLGDEIVHLRRRHHAASNPCPRRRHIQDYPGRLLPSWIDARRTV